MPRDPYIDPDPCPGCANHCGQACKEFFGLNRYTALDNTGGIGYSEDLRDEKPDNPGKEDEP